MSRQIFLVLSFPVMSVLSDAQGNAGLGSRGLLVLSRPDVVPAFYGRFNYAAAAQP